MQACGVYCFYFWLFYFDNNNNSNNGKCYTHTHTYTSRVLSFVWICESFRWLLAAQRCVSAPQSLRSALQAWAPSQTGVDAARCVLHSLTKIAALRGLATTTKGWSVIMAMTWPWPGAYAEVRKQWMLGGKKSQRRGGGKLHLKY